MDKAKDKAKDSAPEQAHEQEEAPHIQNDAASPGQVGAADREGDAQGQEAQNPPPTEKHGAASPAPQREDKGAEEQECDEEQSNEITQLNTALKAAENLAAEHHDKFLRLQAELDNYRKRIQKERSEESKYAQIPVLRELTGVVDNLERALGHAKNAGGQGSDGIVAGVEMVTKQLCETLERHGMKRINSVGQPFDPTMHEALGLVETDAAPENQVMEEYEAGYFVHERILKPAKVMVSKKPAPKPESTDLPQEL